MRTIRCIVPLLTLAVLAGCQKPNSVLRQEAILHVERHQYVEADRKLTLATQRDGADWKAAMLLGELRLLQHRYLDAQLLFERALAIRDEQAETDRILDGLAEALYQQQRYESLHSLLASAASGRGKSAGFVRQARYLGKMGDADGARLAFRKAARFAKPDDATPYLAGADYYESIGNTALAVEALRRAYGIIPNNPRLQARLRAHGIVPGPTAALPPEHVGELPDE